MMTISATDAKQRLASLLDTAQREPVVIRRHERDVAVLLSVQEYERLRAFHAGEFQRFCEQVAAKAKARGMDQSTLDQLLADDAA